MKLSGRLEAVVNMIRPCTLLADVGCDHAYVAIEAVKDGIAEHAVASDAAAGPLNHAAHNIRLAGLEGSIETLLSDGLRAYNDIKPDCVVITGMGGRLITRILMEGLEAGFDLDAVEQLVLGPQSEPEILRHFLLDDMGLNITNEYCLMDEGKFYMLLDVDRADAAEGIHEIHTGDDEAGSSKNGAPVHMRPDRIDAKCPDMVHQDITDVTYRRYSDTEHGTNVAYTEAEYLYGKDIDASTLPIYREWLCKLREQKETALSGIMAMDGLHDDGTDSARAGAKRLANDIRLIDERLSAI